MFETFADRHLNCTSYGKFSSGSSFFAAKFIKKMHSICLNLIQSKLETFHTDVATVNDVIREEFTDFVNDSSACNLYGKNL